MKQGLNQVLKQSLVLTIHLQNQIKLLSMPGEVVRSQINELIDQLNEEEKNDKTFNHFKDTILIDKYNRFLKKNDPFLREGHEVIENPNLKETLLDQFHLLNLKEYEFLIGEYLIDSIEEDGRLDKDIDFQDIQSLIIEMFGKRISAREIEKILFKIQKLEPIGCGFRNVTESLIVQTDCLQIMDSDKDEIKNTLQRIAKGELELNFLSSKEKKIIRQLNFNPAQGIGTVSDYYIRPDILALKDNEGGWRITLNDSFMSNELMDKIMTSVNNSSMETKQEAKSFLKGLERRQKTLLLVTEYLVKHQTNFLNEKGNLIPITNKQVASSVNVSESTISRIVRSKYLQLPNKNILLSSLLEKQVNGRSGDLRRLTPKELIQIIRKLVADENKSHPLSDEKIKKLLKAKYEVGIARRTVSKYRLQANIGSTRERISK